MSNTIGWRPVLQIAARICILSVLSAMLLIPSLHAQQNSINSLVLAEINEMPVGGTYSSSHLATTRLQSAVHFERGEFFLSPAIATPSYCSGATYLVFLKTIEALCNSGRLSLDAQTLLRLGISGQPDGEGIWGRWNANGPGTARLFYELQLGKNFADFNRALPGDFMKIFWTGEVGAKEHGHSVVFLGCEIRDGVEMIRFWSSNVPLGYGEKSVPRSKIAQVIFSRLEVPGNLAKADRLPHLDSYLAGLQTKRSSFAEAGAKCGF